MRYSAQWYASNIVLECGYISAGWPEDVPLTDLCAVGGGINTLHEIRQRWYLPDGDPEKLRFEPASRKDYANATCDPESVHPTPHHLPELKAQAAATSARDKALTIQCDVYPRGQHATGWPPFDVDGAGVRRAEAAAEEEMTVSLPDGRDTRLEVDEGERRRRGRAKEIGNGAGRGAVAVDIT
ncbi:hypothetical protein TRAPUB_8393, partial [Trametes pubescens]